MVAGGDDRVVLMGGVLVANHRILALHTHLPEHRVAGEAGVVAPAAYVAFERVALTGRPVLVVAGPDDEAIAVEEPSAILQICRDRVVESEPVAVGPFDEPALIA